MLSDQSTANQLADMLKAMGHPLRIQIMAIIIAEQFVSIPTLQQGLPDTDPFFLYRNLRYMEKKMLLRKRRKGREIYYGLSEMAIAAGFDLFFRNRTDVVVRNDEQTASFRQNLKGQIPAFS
ncbi:helix-turn-helix transcriptional regulator [Spirosoma sp. BT702]|uniref:Helix-turn-helix transcriptional regulator n=1 Tax=Spirosoma profusum TaxID=2771354 RepID=A0A926Y163_9BACT|nr:helix-turn-helix transcriptional regulator [Spirosoma profusum]MBD2704572.1 helix-turn-helix transcriptional regulator [Spirosoma profusum]